MRIESWTSFLIYFLIFCCNIQLTKGQCEWLYENREPESYIIEENNVVLFYCQNFMDTIYAPNEYIDVFWEYTTESGQQCQDWDWLGNDFFFSINYKMLFYCYR